ncbi:MAG: DUF1566 domain-containing protein [Nitrospira sp.]|nr:DUF1566 domain-containing protein [bacterium]MBL7048828.1 DUF1566 domain-containing protein [Nitrospira sp.]
MKQLIYMIIISLTILAAHNSSLAALLDRGNGMIYDEEINITWLQNANLADRTMTWHEAVNWADTLVYNDYDDWRLPALCTADTCNNDEMLHMFSINEIHSAATGPFINIKPWLYWSGTAEDTNPDAAWRFNFKSGTSGTSSTELSRYAWAVRNGDTITPVAPEPLSTTLFLTGSLVMGTIGYRRHRVK